MFRPIGWGAFTLWRRHRPKGIPDEVVIRELISYSSGDGTGNGIHDDRVYGFAYGFGSGTVYLYGWGPSAYSTHRPGHYADGNGCGWGYGWFAKWPDGSGFGCGVAHGYSPYFAAYDGHGTGWGTVQTLRPLNRSKK